MTTGPEDQDPGGRPEPTIADVMNAFSLDSGRRPKRRRWGRHRPEETEHRRSGQVDRPGGADGGYAGDLYSGDRSFGEPSFDHHDFRGPSPEEGSSGDGFGEDPHREEWDEIDGGGGSTFVRPYAWTRGRTRTGYSLQIETLVSTSRRGREQLALLQLEHRAVADLCQEARSVAEVAALLKVPLGVAKVLVGDMAGIGLVAVHESGTTHGAVPDLALMERVLSGLRRL